jgi:cell wall-associated NlpC family hydrolase
VKFLPKGKSGNAYSRGNRSRLRPPGTWGLAAALATAASALAIVAPGDVASARPAGTPTGLQATVAQANALSNQIDSLGQQYDGLQIELQQAQAEVASAKLTAARDEQALKSGRAAVGQIAAEGYMNGSIDPSIELLQSPNPQEFLNRSSIILQLNYEQTSTVNQLSQASAAAARAQQTASEEEATAKQLSGQMAAKVNQIQSKENLLNSQAYAQALAIFDQTGTYPSIAISGDSLGAQALKWAMTQIGKPYVWGAAGPDAYDCSGLVMWAYAHVGISLMHFTGDQWGEGEHIPTSELAPGDLLFFYNLGHVGLFIGNNLMVDAPSAGQDVMVQEIPWGAFDGAVQIVG